MRTVNPSNIWILYSWLGTTLQIPRYLEYVGVPLASCKLSLQQEAINVINSPISANPTLISEDKRTYINQLRTIMRFRNCKLYRILNEYFKVSHDISLIIPYIFSKLTCLESIKIVFLVPT